MTLLFLVLAVTVSWQRFKAGSKESCLKSKGPKGSPTAPARECYDHDCLKRSMWAGGDINTMASFHWAGALALGVGAYAATKDKGGFVAALREPAAWGSLAFLGLALFLTYIWATRGSKDDCRKGCGKDSFDYACLQRTGWGDDGMNVGLLAYWLLTIAFAVWVYLGATKEAPAPEGGSS